MVAAMVCGAGSAGAADGRVAVAPTEAPWISVGRLNVGGYRFRRHCTATLVAPDRALTARHCLTGFTGQDWARPGQVHFLPGYAHGRFLEHRQAAGFEVAGPEAVLVRLDLPAGLAPVPLAAGAPPKPGARLFQAGYSSDRGHVLTVDPACRLLEVTADGRWLHDCEAISGDSGAPILVDTPLGLAVVAIHIGRSNGVGVAEPLDRNRVMSLLLQ